ncbi:leucyl aminopeptidase [Faecalibacter sp. LW9]|uniref:leucyl aminopeptidase family protein n=1 Tax=Faecalibacter sp. LW9 TaxID=3103144 RepID=UPI002AFFB542|nr:leucyl aminopeptidase [Faecalibacter sp. LW9]
MILLSQTYTLQDNVVFLIDKSSDFKVENNEMIQNLLEEFKASDSKFDYIKLGKQTIALIDANQAIEPLRVNGFNVRQQLNKDAEKVAIVGNGEQAIAVAEGIELSNYQFLKYFKDADEKEYALNQVAIVGEVAESRVIEMNNIIKAVYWGRDMVNEPNSYLTAVQLAKELEEIAKEASIEVKVYQKEKIESLKMGGLLAVNKGSVVPPTFTVLEYKPNHPRNEKPIVLVGKGVVYDTGGLSLKPTPNSMDLMKSDMGGAACMAGAIYAAALNQLDLHIIALIPATDNRPGGDAYAPGDVVTMYDGTTVEVLNTDAEGRMILADAIAYANEYEPSLIVNAATLTGAALVAAGVRASCMMSNAGEEINAQLKTAGNEVYERLVELPLWDDYKEQLKSSVADLKNIGGSYAGTITAGKFLEHFTTYPFVHLDIAEPAFTTTPENYKGLGGTGVGIRLLNQFFKKYHA